MKNLFKNSLLILTGLLIATSCTEEQIIDNKNLNLTIEALASNENFKELIDVQLKLTGTFSSKLAEIPINQHEGYLLSLQTLLEAGDPESIETTAQMMGFKSAKDYSEINNHMLRMAKRLTENFPTIRNDFKTEKIFISAIAKITTNNRPNNSARTLGNCYDILNNCRNKADATLALATTGCVASVFIPVAGPFLGVACEVSALYNHYTDLQKCNLDYEDC